MPDGSPYMAGALTAVYLVSASSNLSDVTAEKVASFANLAVGWDYGEGGPIARETISMALNVITFLRQLGFADIDAFPGAHGEIAIAVIHRDHYIEAIVEPDEFISVAHDIKGRQDSYVPRIQYQRALRTLAVLVGKTWSTSDYFTQANLMSASTGLRVWHSRIHPGPVVYQWWTANVSNLQVQTSALTLADITADKPAIPPSFGNLMPPYYQTHIE